MSEANVELVRKIYERWTAGDSARDLIAADLEYVNPPYAVESGTTAASGVVAQWRQGYIWTVRDGKAVTFRWFSDPAEALEAAGLDTEPGRLTSFATILPMLSDELRTIQAPLKERYRDEPDAAVVTLSAEGTLGEGVSCSVSTGRAIAEAGLHPASGGDGALLCSGDMLLEALVACAGVTLQAVATSLAIPIDGGTVTADGDLDFRGTLGVSKEARVGFGAIRLRFELDTDASEEQLATLLKLTERYCVVLQTLAEPAELTSTLAAR